MFEVSWIGRNLTNYTGSEFALLSDPKIQSIRKLDLEAEADSNQTV